MQKKIRPKSNEGVQFGILSKNQILTSIKGRYSVANLRKTKIYKTNLDLVTDNVTYNSNVDLVNDNG